MISGYWHKARGEWRANRRLRLAGLVALAFLAFHAMAAMDARRQVLADQYSRDLGLQARLQGMRGQKDWIERAKQAQAALDDMQARVPEVTSAGLAQAELQSWLTGLAAKTALANPKVKVEDTLEVPDYPEMWQVMARLDGELPEYGQGAFLRALSEGLPWIQAERLEVSTGGQGRLMLVVRGYYRRAIGEGEAGSPSAAGSDAGSATP